MIHRHGKGRPGDFHEGKWNGLGGKCELDESFANAARRELKEESGLEPEASAFRCLGFLQFPNFKPHKSEDWICAVYRVELPRQLRDQVRAESVEGSLRWIPMPEVTQLALWPGDRKFIPYVLKGQAFAGTFWYRDGELIRSEVSAI